MIQIFHRLRTIALGLSLLGSMLASNAQAELPERLQFLPTYRLFEQIRSDPAFNLSKPSTFGYFFNASNESSLVRIREALEKDGYVFVSTHIDSKRRAWIQMAKVEAHTPETMVERNRMLHALAGATGEVEYDGWDITRNSR